MSVRCPNCKSEDVQVTGIYILCNSCGFIDDSTFEQIMDGATLVENEK